ncbi:MAG: hypothetical protein AAGM22_06550 [Acidobacteriota bacterium]
MSKKNCARLIAVIASILMLSVAPMSFAADAKDSGGVTIGSFIEDLVETIGDLFGGGNEAETEQEDEEEDGGVPDLRPQIDPFG